MLGELSHTELMDYANELENENQKLTETKKELIQQKEYFMKHYNEKNNIVRRYHNNLIELIENETDIKELKKAFEYIRNLKIKGQLNNETLKEFQKRINNETIFNLCVLLVRDD